MFNRPRSRTSYLDRTSDLTGGSRETSGSLPAYALYLASKRRIPLS